MKTRSKLLADRKREFRGHPTYDLNGDGIVSEKEMVISKLFDIGKKGYLTDQERNTAIQALEDGIEKNYKWGLEQSGVDGNHRIIQKRGKIVIAEEFDVLQGTYPPYDNRHSKYQHYYEEPNAVQQKVVRDSLLIQDEI
jgi:hypothetical protein